MKEVCCSDVCNLARIRVKHIGLRVSSELFAMHIHGGFGHIFVIFSVCFLPNSNDVTTLSSSCPLGRVQSDDSGAVSFCP